MSFIVSCQSLLSKAALQGCILNRSHACVACGIGRLVIEAPFPDDMGKRRKERSPVDDDAPREKHRHHKSKHSKTKRSKEEKCSSRHKHKSPRERTTDGAEVKCASHQLQTVTEFSLLKTATLHGSSQITEVSSISQISSVLNSEEKLAECLGLEGGKTVGGSPSKGSNAPLSPPLHQPSSQPARAYSTHTRRTRRHEELEDGQHTEDVDDSHSETATEMPQVPRQWEWTTEGRRLGYQTLPEGLVFTTMTYNILSQVLLERHRGLYGQSPPEALEWNSRRQKLLTEILCHSPEIVCLQEVEEAHYKDYFQKELETRGYQGHFQKRTNDKTDGCAIFFKHNKFHLVEATPVTFNKGSLLDRDNVALILQLAPNSKWYSGTERKICVATTHLLFNPRRGDIKLAQLMVLLAELDRCARVPDPRNPAFHATCPTILCGDFNLEPNSFLFNFLASGYLYYEGMYANVMSGQQEGLYSSRRWTLARDFFPSHMPISNGCQYIHHLADNLRGGKDEAASAASSSVSSSETVSASPSAASSVTSTVTSSVSATVTSSESNQGSTHQPWSVCSSSDSNWRTVHRSNSAPSAGFANQLPGHHRPSSSHMALLQHTGEVRHRFQFLSVYRGFVERLQGEPEVTTQHSAAQCTVDYIFYTVGRRVTLQRRGRLEVGGVQEGKLKLLGRYGLMSSREVARLGNLPNKDLPSDHLCLCAKFLLV